MMLVRDLHGTKSCRVLCDAASRNNCAPKHVHPHTHATSCISSSYCMTRHLLLLRYDLPLLPTPILPLPLGTPPGVYWLS